MQYEASTPAGYIQELDSDWRKDVLLEIRALIQAFELTEVIEYKMLGYQDNNKTIFNLNAQQNYVSLYVGDIQKIDESKELLKGLNTGKGCIRFKNQGALTSSRINEFIKKAIELHRKGVDIGC